jgi:hypothetical protein
MLLGARTTHPRAHRTTEPRLKGQVRRTSGVVRGGRKTSSPTRCGDKEVANCAYEFVEMRGASRLTTTGIHASGDMPGLNVLGPFPSHASITGPSGDPDFDEWSCVS